MSSQPLERPASQLPISMTLVIAIVLLAIGLPTAFSMLFHIGPFG